MSAILKPVLLQTRYTWEAELSDGSIMSVGGDISDAIRVSLLPAPGTGLSRHDLVGQQFSRRFIRQFKRATVGGFDKAAYLAEVEANKTAARVEARRARDERLKAQGVESLPAPPSEPKKEPRRDEVVQVICCETFRYYVRHSDGAAIVTPPDYELWL